VNEYDQLGQVGRVRSQGRQAQTARWGEIMKQEKILLGGDWIAHSDGWEPQCPPKRDATLLENLMDEYELIDVTDGEATHPHTRNGETLDVLIDCLIINTYHARQCRYIDGCDNHFGRCSGGCSFLLGQRGRSLSS